MPVRIELGGAGSRELEQARMDIVRAQTYINSILMAVRNGNVDEAMEYVHMYLRLGLLARTKMVKARRRAMLGEQKKKQQLKKKGK